MSDRDENGRFTNGNGNAWQPGQSGNPAGRPKRVSFEAYVEQILDESDTRGDGAAQETMPKRERLARAFVDRLESKHDTRLLVEYLRRNYPPVTEFEVRGYEGWSVEGLAAAFDRFTANGTANGVSEQPDGS